MISRSCVGETADSLAAANGPPAEAASNRQWVLPQHRLELLALGAW